MKLIINMEKKQHGERIKVVPFLRKINANFNNFLVQETKLVVIGKVQLTESVIWVLLVVVTLICISLIQYALMTPSNKKMFIFSKMLKN